MKTRRPPDTVALLVWWLVFAGVQILQIAIVAASVWLAFREQAYFTAGAGIAALITFVILNLVMTREVIQKARTDHKMTTALPTFHTLSASPDQPLRYKGLTIKVSNIIRRRHGVFADLVLRAGTQTAPISSVAPDRLLEIGQYRIVVIDIVDTAGASGVRFTITRKGDA